jgi:predicted ATPase
MLDNCEHLVDAAARFTKDLLGACEGLTVLATSREPLGVPGEIVWPVPTLSLPEPGEGRTVEDLMVSERYASSSSAHARACRPSN